MNAIILLNIVNKFLLLVLLRRNIYHLILVIVSLLIFDHSPLYSQEKGRLFIKNFDRKDFNASASNFSLTQDTRGHIVVGNYDGVIKFDGINWSFIPIQNNLIGLAVACDQNGRIFTSTHGDFGYLKPDSLGKLHYSSLGKLLPKELDLGIFWDIIPTSKGIFFHSPKLIVRWENGTLAYWKSENESNFRFLFDVNKTLLIVQSKKGIMRLEGDSLIEIPNTKRIVNEELAFIEVLSNDALLFGTNESGIYIFKDGHSYRTETGVNAFIHSNRLYTSEKNSDKVSQHSYAIGTLTGGIAILDSTLQITTVINKSNGLPTDVIKDVHFDMYNNLWSATNEGVSHIELSSPWQYWNKADGLFGSPNVILRYNDTIFTGTPEGLFQLQGQALHKVSGINSKVWDMCKVNSRLVIACQEGLFELNKDKLSQIANFPEVTQLSVAKLKRKSLLIVGHSNGISILSVDQQKITTLNAFEIPNSTFTSIGYNSHDSSIWVSAKFNGIYKIKNFLDKNDPEIKKYGIEHGLPDINNIKIIKKNKKLLFATTSGLYRFNTKRSIFERDSSVLKQDLNINDVVQDNDGNYVISVVKEDRSRHIELLRKQNGQYKRHATEFKRLPQVGITALYSDGDNYIWFGGSEGLYRFDRTIKKNYSLPFITVMRKVSVRDSAIFYGNYFDNTDTTGVPPIILNQPEHFKPDLEYKNNNLTFEYTAAFYEAPERTLYSYFLENNDLEWSKWNSDTKKEYNNLSAGTYTFHVKARNIYNTEGSIASYQFTILPPWHQTFWAYILFIIIGFLFIWFVALIYSYRVRMQRRRLKLIVADRTYEVINQKKEIERQRDLLQHQYEEICNQRDSIQQKNRKLQAAQNETIYANEALQKLNTHLEKEVEKRTERIKQTLQQLQNKNKELDTFIYRASHDLKGPISRISGLSTLAKMAVPPDADKSFVELIEVTANNMKVLISKLTQVHDLNNAQIKNERIDIADLLISIRNTLNHLEDESINYTFHFNEDLEVIGDKDLLGIIIQNILENALVFKKPRGLQNNILLEIGSTKESLTIRIYDTGIGILPDQIDRIYDMFYKGANQSIGSGLGLYLVKMTVEKLNGSISVRSKVHEFTEFTVTIPL